MSTKKAEPVELLTIETLTALLTEADVAHRAFEQQHGATEWPEWYAARLHEALGTEYPYRDILESLKDAAAAHHFYEVETGGPHAEWAEWYATHMVGALR
jgi:hypothetical protein